MKTITTPVVAFGVLLTAITACHKTDAPSAAPITMHSSGDNAETNSMLAMKPCGDPVTLDLVAGQYTDAGSVNVYNTEDSLYVTFVTDGNWKMGKTRLYVGDAPTPAVPKAKKFSFSHTRSSYATYDRYAVALSSIPPCFTIATHAELHEISPDGTILQTRTGRAEENSANEPEGRCPTIYCTRDCSDQVL